MKQPHIVCEKFVVPRAATPGKCPSPHVGSAQYRNTGGSQGQTIHQVVVNGTLAAGEASIEGLRDHAHDLPIFSHNPHGLFTHKSIAVLAKTHVVNRKFG